MSLKRHTFVNLDSLLEDQIVFQFKGKEYALKNLDVKTFMNLTNEITNVQNLLQTKEITPQEVVKRYAALIGTLCDEVTIEMIESMSQSQTAALLQLCLDFATGKVHNNTDVEKKSPPSLIKTSVH